MNLTDRDRMLLARAASVFGTCDRLKVGVAVFLKDDASFIYECNGAVDGLPTCTDTNHALENNFCSTALHAEMHAVSDAARNGLSLNGASIFCTHSPCWPCFRMLANCGIKRVVFAEKFYRDFDRIAEAAKMLNISLEQLEE